VADETGRQQGVEFNPYRAPAARVEAQPRVGPEPAAGEPTEAMIDHLRGTAPWALFLAIIGFIGAGFMVLSGLTLFVMMPFMGAGQTGSTEPSVVGILIFTGVFYLAGGAADGVASYFLVRYSQAIARVNETRTLGDVERAIASQHGFWRATGLVTVLIVCLALVFFVALIAYVAALAAAEFDGMPAI
jgi:hypothetical protein